MSRKIADLEFARRPERTLKLDLYLPEPPGKPAPVLIWIYGGGWLSGSKDPCHTEYMTASGFAAASIEYRYSQEAIFPAAVEDCHAAVCWLRSHAAEFGLDGRRIGLFGPSAGGHLTALLGTSGHYRNWSGFDGPPDCGAVQAVVDVSGPTLLTRYADRSLQQKYPDLSGVITRFLGGPVEQRLAQARDASPATYVHPGCPPFLILHGRQDEIVPIEEAALLHEALLACGVDSTFLPVTDAGHGIIKPWVPPLVLDFFQRTLRP